MWLGGNGKAHKGQQLLERVKGFIKYYGAGVKLKVTSTAVWVDGETAFETGKYAYQYQKNGQPTVDEGRYATIWKRQKDGSWKLFLDMPVQ
jgi:ketosteroid isomerase-like protein